MIAGFILQNYCSAKKLRTPRFRSKTDMELKCRENPIVVQLDTPEFKSIFTDEVLDLKKLFEKYQYEIRIAGGAVRYQFYLAHKISFRV